MLRELTLISNKVRRNIDDFILLWSLVVKWAEWLESHSFYICYTCAWGNKHIMIGTPCTVGKIYTDCPRLIRTHIPDSAGTDCTPIFSFFLEKSCQYRNFRAGTGLK